ncbi:MAG: prepilin-type N-terminal cleavage/methylation domain-containing protein [Desulfosarcina sp.]|nr:prepilin-type N-terminal cleavage/methylation domain-containing protein [Desulfobacterales bacterium]
MNNLFLVNPDSELQYSGFTLLELMIVMILMGLMTALVVPVTGSTIARMELKTAAKKTASALRYCRNRAAMEKITCTADIDFSDNILSVIKKKDPNKEPENKLSANNLKEKSVKKYKLPEGVVIKKIDYNGDEIDHGKFSFIFFPNGSCSGGTITLAGKKAKTFSIKVDSITGIVKIED